jgi:hypothetical protein
MDVRQADPQSYRGEHPRPSPPHGLATFARSWEAAVAATAREGRARSSKTGRT